MKRFNIHLFSKSIYGIVLILLSTASCSIFSSQLPRDDTVGNVGAVVKNAGRKIRSDEVVYPKTASLGEIKNDFGIPLSIIALMNGLPVSEETQVPRGTSLRIPFYTEVYPTLVPVSSQRKFVGKSLLSLSSQQKKSLYPLFEGDVRMMWPLPSRAPGSRFGPRNGRMHRGVDIPAPKGTPIFSALKGKVTFVGYKRGFGRVVDILSSNMILTRYAHLSQFSVKKSQRIQQGKVIGTVGATGNARGNHLHFEVRVNSTAIDPLLFFTSRTIVRAALSKKIFRS